MNIFAWLWQHVAGPALGSFFSTDWGLVVGLALAGAAIGLAFKYFGWRGVLGAAIAVVSLGIFRAGWRARDSLAPNDRHIDPPGPVIEVPPLQPAKPGKPVKPKKLRYDNETKTWH